MTIAFAVLLFVICQVSSNEVPGSVRLDSLTFDKIVGGKRPVLVKFDKAYASGEKQEAWKAFAERVGGMGESNNLLLADVGLREHGGEKEKQSLKERYNLEMDKLPYFLLFNAHSRTPVFYPKKGVSVDKLFSWIKRATGTVTEPEWNVKTLAGNGTSTFLDHKNSKLAAFFYPSGVTVDPNTNDIYITDTFNYRIRKITATTFSVSTIAGNGVVGSKDGLGEEANFNRPYDIKFDELKKRLILTDHKNHKIRCIETLYTSPTVRTLAGHGYGYRDGNGLEAQFAYPIGVVINKKNGIIFVSDFFNHRIRQIEENAQGQTIVTTYAGTGQAGFLDGNRNECQFYHPSGMTLDSHTGNLFIADYSGHRIRLINGINGKVVTLVGRLGGYFDGIGRKALFKHPFGLTMDLKENIYITEYGNHRIRKLNRINTTLPITSPSSWQVTTIAGTGSVGSKDGISFESTFHHPYGITVDNSNNLLVTDTWNHKLRIIVEIN